MVSVTLGWISGQVQKWRRNLQRVRMGGRGYSFAHDCIFGLRSDRLLMNGGAVIIIETGLVESRCETLSR